MLIQNDSKNVLFFSKKKQILGRFWLPSLNGRLCDLNVCLSNFATVAAKKLVEEPEIFHFLGGVQCCPFWARRAMIDRVACFLQLKRKPTTDSSTIFRHDIVLLNCV